MCVDHPNLNIYISVHCFVEKMMHNQRLCLIKCYCLFIHECFFSRERQRVRAWGRTMLKIKWGRNAFFSALVSYFLIYFFSLFSAADSAREEPLPDLLPQNEPPSWASPHHRPPRAEAVQELEVRRVADQLRAIGDEFNATVLHRAVRAGAGLQCEM